MTEKDKNEQLKHSGEQRKATKKQPPPSSLVCIICPSLFSGPHTVLISCFLCKWKCLRPPEGDMETHQSEAYIENPFQKK